MVLLTTGLAAAGVYEDMVHAVNNDDERTVTELLKKGVDVNSIGPNGDSLLIIAVRHGNPAMVKAVLDGRPRVDLRNAQGETALMLAALNGRLEVVRQLLERGAEVNHGGWTPLIYAASRNQVEVARLLVKQGAQVNAQATNGTSALMMAVREGHLQMTLLMLELGADINLRNDDGQSALGLAKARDRADIAQLLVRAGAVE
jgi:hypothetical protein